MSSARRPSSSWRSSLTPPSSPTSFPSPSAAPSAAPERSVDGTRLDGVLPRRHDEDLAGIDQVGIADVAPIGLVDHGIAHRTDERSVGNVSVSHCRSRWLQIENKKTQQGHASQTLSTHTN